MLIGDLQICGTPSPHLTKALGIVDDMLHAGFAAQPGLTPEISKRSCVLCSLTVRDFLRQAGIKANVRSVAMIIRATDKQGQELHSTGVGIPHQRDIDSRNWAGHMVVECEGFLIDTTLYQAIRPSWADLPPMIATPLLSGVPERLWDMDLIAGAEAVSEGHDVTLGWFDRAENRRWRTSPDAMNMNRRLPVVRAMTTRWKRWLEISRSSSRQ